MSADRIIVAVDTPTAEEALELARQLRGRASWLKVGMTLFYTSGPAVVLDMIEMGFRVFVDLKLHDIPHQVEGAARSLGMLGAGMLTVHASGGEAMIRAAVQGACAGAELAGVAAPKVIAVTVLTSSDDAMLASVGVRDTAADQVRRLGTLAGASAADGVVCSPLEAALMREILGDDALVVTPGVRPAGSDAGDQSRIATPAAALAAGASHLVIGRPITAAADPGAAFDVIAAEL
jgi:orotidine-5'-phosphate decarboxylase